MRSLPGRAQADFMAKRMDALRKVDVVDGILRFVGIRRTDMTMVLSVRAAYGIAVV